MAKHFKLRIFKVIPSFQSCRSKDPSTIPADPVPSIFKPSPLHPTISTVDLQRPSSKPHRSSIRRHVSSALTSVGCGGFISRSHKQQQHVSSDDHSSSPDAEIFEWQKEDKWHTVAKIDDENETPRRKIYNSSVSSDSEDQNNVVLAPTLLIPTVEKKKRKTKKKRNFQKVLRISTSSADSGLFSSERDYDEDEEEEEEETETLVSSSRSFSTDSLETVREIPTTKKNRRKKKRNKKKTRTRTRTRKVRMSCTSPECESPARLSMFQRLISCAVDGKVRESFAVVKKSEDPYEDFKRSMMEMILGKQMFEEDDLEQLLHCFLSLNSREHHALIVEVFSEIWEALFSKTPIATGRVSVKAL